MKLANQTVPTTKHQMKISSSLRHVLAGSAAALRALTLGTGSALATNGTWGTNTSGNWSVGPWTGGTPNAIGDTANFGGGLSSGTKTWTFDLPVTLGVLNLDTNRTSNYNGTGANVLIFDNTGSTNAQLNVAALGNNNQSFGVEIRLMDSLDIVNNLPAGNKTLGINAISSYNGNLTITNNSVYHATTAATQFRSAISDGTGTISLVNAAGVAALQVANTFSGSTTVSGGILRLDNALSLQNSALNTTGSIAGNGTNGLQINTGVTALTLGGLNGNKNFTQTGGVFTSNVANGNYNNITALTLNPGTGKSYSYDGVIGNGAAGMTLTKTGAGTQTLTGTHTYSGATTISAGTLQLSGTGAVNTSSGITVNGSGARFITNSSVAVTPRDLRCNCWSLFG